MSKNRNPEETIQKILDTTLELFKEKGYAQTTILDIVDKMGVSRGAFYHHFKSKEDVLDALLERKVNRGQQLEVYNNDSLTGLEKIRMLMFDANVGFFFLHNEDIQLLHMSLDLLKDPRLMAEHVKEIQGEGAADLKVLVEEGMKDGSIVEQNPLLLAELILLLLTFWIIPPIYSSGSQEMFEQKIMLIKQILDALGCPLIDEEIIQMFKGVVQEYDHFNNRI